ncbi:DNA-binding transcriptional LysR family regulator [Inhella inkyongensis]|uniref:DNA-binding transcriptional LysR family regulator n=1 Tax=Inhella inkyongensis TaxID=392593 RepID=A0A840S3Z6_9BURK|nr:LysR family transcriptional regulator [Inhella inkyongensis]MBB5203544.1 DNA-binding transcriptional LysR family regulator [Inhella inkyongensis]
MNSPIKEGVLSTRELQRRRNRQDLDANALELFARVVAAGSFAQAARQLGLTRAAISRRVAAIEAQSGQALFARTTRSLGLTEAGRQLARRAQAVHEAAGAARAVLRNQRDELAGRLRITSVTSFGMNVLVPLLAEFRRAHPAIELDLLFTDRRMDLLREGIDVAFRITRRPPQDWVAQAVLHFRIGAYAAQGPARGEPDELQGLPLLLVGGSPEPLPLRWQQRDGERQQTLEIRPQIAADQMEPLLALARAGAGVVLAPDYAVAADLATGRLVDLLPDWHLPIAEGDAVQALTLPEAVAGPNARALVRFVAQRLQPPTFGGSRAAASLATVGT